MIYNNNRIGAAYYNSETSEIFVMDDVLEDDFSFTVSKALYWQCLPKTILTVTGALPKFVKAVKETMMNNASAENRQFNDRCSMSSTSLMHNINIKDLKQFSKKEYSYEYCHNRVRNLKLDSELPETLAQEREVFLNSLLNFHCQNMIHALGLLLLYVDKNWNAMTLTHTQPKYLCVTNVTL